MAYDGPQTDLSFGQAFLAAEQGEKIARAEWSYKNGAYIYIDDAHNFRCVIGYDVVSINQFPLKEVDFSAQDWMIVQES